MDVRIILGELIIACMERKIFLTIWSENVKVRRSHEQNDKNKYFSVCFRAGQEL